jgi:1,2-phenylacetyl-CoA epoxidase catalytic subunit
MNISNQYDNKAWKGTAFFQYLLKIQHSLTLTANFSSTYLQASRIASWQSIEKTFHKGKPWK